jgi:hypothetical protein
MQNIAIILTLLVWVPLQLLLLGWVYWHCVRPHAAAS